MICESGIGEKHLMPEEGAVYVYTAIGSRAWGEPYRPRVVGELVACQSCAEQLAADPRVLEVAWSEGRAVLNLVYRPQRRRKGGPSSNQSRHGLA
jgi:hypothetical protein